MSLVCMLNRRSHQYPISSRTVNDKSNPKMTNLRILSVFMLSAETNLKRNFLCMQCVVFRSMSCEKMFSQLA